MNKSKTLNDEKSSEQNAFSQIENLSRKKKRKVAATIESEQKLNFKEREDIKNNPDDLNSNEKDNRPKILIRRDKENTFPSPKKKVKIEHETDSTNTVNFQKNTKFGKVAKGQRQRKMSFRRQVLEMQMRKKMSLESCHERNKPQTIYKSQDLPEKNSRIPHEANKVTRSCGVGSFDTKFDPVIEFGLKPASSNQSQELSNKGHPSCPADYITAKCTSPSVTATKSQSRKVRSAEEVWAHFRWHMQTKKESFDRFKTQDNSIESMQTSECEHCNLRDRPKTATKSASQSFVDPVETATEYATIQHIHMQLPDHLRSETSATLEYDSMSVTEAIQRMQLNALKEIMHRHTLLIIKGQEFRQEKNMTERIQVMIEANKLKENINPLFNVLYDQQTIFNLLKGLKTQPRSIKESLSKSTSLMHLPLSPTDIQTFSMLFLYLYKSLYSELPIENIFCRMNSENCLLAYSKYLSQTAKRRDFSFLEQCLLPFNSYLEECLEKMKCKIPHPEDISIVDYPNYFNDLRIAIDERLNCLKAIISTGSSLLLPVFVFVNQSSRRMFKVLAFLTQRRTDIFL